jgi:hypothetical protein
MTFRVGQKVCRIGGGSKSRVTLPPLHEPVTVSNVFVTHWGNINIEIAEYPAPECAEFVAGFHSKYFRPVVERKTDISIFQRMLTPNKETVQ